MTEQPSPQVAPDRDLALLSDWLAQTAESERLAARFVALANCVRAGVVLMTRDRVLFTNDAARSLLAMPAEELPRIRLQRFFPDPTLRNTVRDAVKRAWLGDAVDLDLVPVTFETGPVRLLSVALRHLRREIEPTLLVVLQDAVAKDQRQPSTAGPEETDTLRAFGLYLAELANDLRGPLTAYLGHLEALTRRSDLPGDLREAFELYRQVTSDSLRRLARAMEWGRRRPLNEHVSLETVIQAAVTSLEGEAFSRTIHLNLDLAPVPAIAGIADQLQLAVEHLLRNACEALATRGGNVYITLRARDGRPVVVVKDDGPGIPDSLFPHAFEPFASSKSIASGLGLGLAIVKDIVTRHRGEVKLESGGTGTTVTLSFEPLDRAPSTSRSAERRRLLLLDDDAELQETYRLLLERAGYEIVSACSAQEAIELLSAGPLDGLLVDVQMSGQDGLGFVEAIATWYPHLLPKVALHTAFAYEDRVRAIADQHGITVLQKPCPFPALLQAVKGLVEQRTGG